MFDMVVATTVALASRPRACRSRPASSSTASPLTTLPVSSAKSTRSASPSKVMPSEALCLVTSAATTSGCSAPQPRLMLRPSGLAWVTVTVPPKSAKSCGATARGRAVRAVDDDALVIEREPRHGCEQEADVLGAVGLVDWRGVERCPLSVLRRCLRAA